LSGASTLNLGTTTSQRIAQSFVAGDWSSSLALWTWLASSVSSPTGGIRFSIQADSSGSPSGTDLTSYSPTAGFVTGSDFDSFSPYYQLTNGVTYWFVLDRLGTDSDTSYYRVNYNPSNTYGVLKVYNGSTWNTVTGSLRFAIDDASDITLSQQISIPYNGGALFWRMRTTDTSYQQIISNSRNGSSAFIGMNRSANTITFESKTNNVIEANMSVGGMTIADGEWHSYCVVFGASNFKLYVDGINTYSRGSAMSDSVAQTYNYIGSYGSRINGTYGRGLNGDICNVTEILFEPTADEVMGYHQGADWGFSTWS
jgi:hypothetical protein